MLFKTKLLLSLGTLGVAGGTGAGVYLLKNKKEEKDKAGKEKGSPSPEPEGNIPAQDVQSPSTLTVTTQDSISS